MKLPHFCPKCKEPLVNKEIFSMLFAKDTWKKTCHLKLDHKISCTYNFNTSEVILFHIRLSEHIEVCWDFKQQTIIVVDPAETIKNLLLKTSHIPFFEPNPHKYKELVSKIKTYIIFS